jgi:enoyl-CoA hydratase/carnithine racemase
MPIEARENDGLLTLTVDTPGSTVNVFTRPTAHQLCEIMAAVDAAHTRAIVFRTAKRNSFINDVGLLLAHASRSEDDVVKASAPARAAYRAVRESKVPTVAAIEGSCWGCGVEFVLQCDYRIASDADNTQLYMTEVNDYLFLPLFGSTWDLPATVGLEQAIDLLLFGERLTAARALATGLLDAVVPAREMDTRSDAFARRVAGRSRRERPAKFGALEERIAMRTRARLEDLPPAYRVVYDGALALLVGGARRRTTFDKHLAEELVRSAATATSALGKAAFGLFYLRQMAAQLSGSARMDAPVRLEVEGSATAPMLSEVVRGSYVARECGDEERVAVGDASGAPRAGIVAVALSPDQAAAEGWDAMAYAPMWGIDVRFVEISTRGQEGRALARRFAAYLGRAHVAVALSHAREEFASDRLIRSFLAPLAEFIRRGGDPATIDATLRDAGFTHRPRTWALQLGASALREILRVTHEEASALCSALGKTHERCAPSPALWASVALSLLAIVDDDLAGFEHVVMMDLAARELLGFPLRETSLCSYLKTARVAILVEDADDNLLGPNVRKRACDFAARRKEFYR